MGIKIVTRPDFQRMGEKFSELVLKEVGLVAADAAEAIRTDSARGVDADGNAFKPYSAKYARFKTRKKKRSNKVDLNLSGDMMRSIQSDVVRKGKKIIGKVFSPEGGKVAGNNKTRKFFTISKRRKQDFLDRLNNLFGRTK